MENRYFKCGDIVYLNGQLYEITDEMYLVWYLEIFPMVYILTNGLGTEEKYALATDLKKAESKDVVIWRILYGFKYKKK